MLKCTDKEVYIEEECSGRTAWLICNYELAAAVRKETERTVNEHVRTVQGYNGKDFMIDDPKKNSAMKRACWSDKVHHAAARIITWSTPAGLTVEHSPLYMARATVTAIDSIPLNNFRLISLG
jgi:hypothetical protein